LYCFVLTLILVFAQSKANKNKIRMDGSEDRHLVEFIKSKLPHSYKLSLPDGYDIRRVNTSQGIINYATPIRNQMIPIFCGSCWAFAATSALNDRFKIFRNNQFPDVQISPQHLLNCGDAGDCNGGSSYYAYKWIMENGISDETCAPYQASDFSCDPINICRICHSDQRGCVVINEFEKYYVTEYGYIPSQSHPSPLGVVHEMMSEIFMRGPIACHVLSDDIFEAYKSGIMMNHPWNSTDHLVAVSGWGHQMVNGKDIPYWIVRNSYGSFWGEGGWFRIVRGQNALGIESGCSWGVPKIN